eukprot:15425358-Alexandrium_andersonii.AAC.1
MCSVLALATKGSRFSSAHAASARTQLRPARMTRTRNRNRFPSCGSPFHLGLAPTFAFCST